MRVLRRMFSGPNYPPNGGDLRNVRVAGLDLSLRATVTLFVATAVLILDATGRLALPAVRGVLGDGDPALDLSVSRAVLFGVVPLAVVGLGFRDGLGRYGLRLGDWRWGVGLLVVGLAVMTPILWAASRLPDVATYYRAVPGTLPEVALRNALEVIPGEFLLRGFLLFVLFRRMGPLAVVVVQVPFVFIHLGKPEIEIWSTFLGGAIYAWLNWRTGSIVWSALGHLYVLTLIVALARAA